MAHLRNGAFRSVVTHSTPDQDVSTKVHKFSCQKFKTLRQKRFI